MSGWLASRGFAVALVALAVSAIARPVAGAPPGPDSAEVTASRQHYTTASRLYDLAEFEPALAEFKEAYRIVGDPAFLFNIAQCHRKLGHTQDAISFYRTYLRRAPQAANRDEVERRIAELERMPPATPPVRAPEAATAPAPAAAAPIPAASPPPSTEAALVARPGSTSEAAERPIYTRAWFWIVAGVVVAGAATTVVLLATRNDPASGPLCGDCAVTTPIDPR